MNEILSRFCPRIEFDSYEDFFENYRCNTPANFNFAYDVVDEWARLQPEKIALIWTNDAEEMKTYTFTEIKRQSDKAANALLALGIRKGDVVMLILKQRPEVWIMMTALEKIGAICIPGTFQLAKKDLVYRCEIAEVTLLVAVSDDEELMANITEARKECQTLKHIALVGDVVNGDFLDLRKLIADAPTEFSRPHGDADTRMNESMLIYFSSGTSGMPKMVLHNHTLPLGHIVTAQYWQCVENGKVHLTQTDSGWAKFAWGKIYGQWICGAIIGAYDTEKFTPQGMLSALARLKPTTFCAPATIFRFLIKEDLSGIDFSFIKHASVAGEPLSPEVFHQLKQKTGLEIREGFGQSEGSVLAASFKWLTVKPGSMGKPSPLYGLDLLDENRQSVDDGVVGNISVTQAGRNIYEELGSGRIETHVTQTPTSSEKSPEIVETESGNCEIDGAPHQNSLPGLFRGYWKDENTTRLCWHDGVYQTGDMAWRDGEGYFWFVGRNDDVIKCSGYRIGPFEVESALMEHPSVLECAVTAAPDPMRGQVVKATVVLARGFSPLDELKRDLQNHVKRVTAPYKYPRIIDFVSELPKTISGKIQRNIIRKRDQGK
ncbi:MAG: AMP-binding protein [Treponema sp.]|nr:AMP-binding protein [Treponema sp.]